MTTSPHTPRDPQSRRELRASALLDTQASAPRHVRDRRAARIGFGFAAVVAASLLVGSAVAVTAAISGPAIAHDSTLNANSSVDVPMPAAAEEIPVPTDGAVAVADDICALDGVVAKLDSGEDEAAIIAAGGGEAVRAAIAAGQSECFSLDDPEREWVVINKTRPLDPIDYAPSSLVGSEGVQSISGGKLRSDPAVALAEMVAAAAGDGVGVIALQSAYRSYTTQQSSYGTQVDARGVAGADMVSARPGYSEHQTGLAADVVACDGGCGTLDELAATPQGEWVAAESWRYGWVVRYEEGFTEISGYSPEPWHLRYIGNELAAAYHAGGYSTLEDFFGLDAAPNYTQ
ncbi:M15 family metallopeptidase [Microbacterium sp. NPDC076911]|uniref:M15 family metallopeptidase n=1 Tax=Microbacterium sp. NPDC076911 TaxID=3154958 RepID=UPI003444629E